MTKRDLHIIDTIIVHYSQTPVGREVSMDEMTGWHKVRGMDDIAYHFLVHLDGGLSIGRPLSVVGAHAYGRNKTSVGICYVGGTVEGGVDTRTEKQKNTLTNLIMSLDLILPNLTSVIGHNDVSDKECPAFNVGNEYNHILNTNQETC